MKSRMGLLLIVLVLVIAGLTFGLWYATLMHFVGVNSEVIQGLASLVQIVLWVGAALVFGFVLCLRPTYNISGDILPPATLVPTSFFCEAIWHFRAP